MTTARPVIDTEAVIGVPAIKTDTSPLRREVGGHDGPADAFGV